MKKRIPKKIEQDITPKDIQKVMSRIDKLEIKLNERKKTVERKSAKKS